MSNLLEKLGYVKVEPKLIPNSELEVKPLGPPMTIKEKLKLYGVAIKVKYVGDL